MKIVYRIDSSGRATNLRFENDDYVLKTGEVEYGSGSRLPNIDELHSSKYRLRKQKIAELIKLRMRYYTIIDALIDTLINKGVISVSDFPSEIQAIILMRKRLEQELKNL